MKYAVRFDKHAVPESCCLLTRSGEAYSGNHLRLSLSRFLTFSPLSWPTASRRILSLWDEHKSIFVSDIRLRHRGRATVFRNEDTALSYVLLKVQESLMLMVNFTLEIFQLPIPQDDLPDLIVEGEVPELDTERLWGAVDEAIPKLNAGQIAVFDA